MEQYISKSALIAEIKKRIKEREEEEKKGWAYSRVKIVECEHILSFINTLEVKEISDEYDEFLGKELKMIDDEVARLEKLKVKEVDLDFERNRCMG